jgi:hypothetical protein
VGIWGKKPWFFESCFTRETYGSFYRRRKKSKQNPVTTITQHNKSGPNLLPNNNTTTVKWVNVHKTMDLDWDLKGFRLDPKMGLDWNLKGLMLMMKDCNSKMSFLWKIGRREKEQRGKRMNKRRGRKKEEEERNTGKRRDFFFYILILIFRKFNRNNHMLWVHCIFVCSLNPAINHQS